MLSIISVLCCLTLYVSSTLAATKVPLIFNVFYDQSNERDGLLPDSVLSQQMSVLNKLFSPVGVFFYVASRRQIPIDYDTLHVGDSYIGNSSVVSFPWDYKARPQADGIIIRYNCLPGGKAVGYNTGKMLATAVGHWTGLYATSHGGCDGEGDFVDDTPAEATPAYGCPEGRDTCPGRPGQDPVHNMMDSTVDDCRVGFTDGQFSRLRTMMAQFRGIHL